MPERVNSTHSGVRQPAEAAAASKRAAFWSMRPFLCAEGSVSCAGCRLPGPSMLRLLHQHRLWSKCVR